MAERKSRDERSTVIPIKLRPEIPISISMPTKIFKNFELEVANNENLDRSKKIVSFLFKILSERYKKEIKCYQDLNKIPKIHKAIKNFRSDFYQALNGADEKLSPKILNEAQKYLNNEQ